ncbi:LysR family transcriptional regulator [Sphingomonas colocasiae]|uniref:LysR family transcriptional regulator n=1 Tax=Sphingomonas colocasiae TaxID=1848973 RepID=A0ABS7PWM5_9SPHN|nr:LysR family transcriptional regulator [Sphingomonas colocasiae]MBY8825758.1 LysR family transcriptional regulator [Sphingomonas colocasiae]
MYSVERFSGVRAFVAVAECGSFNGAAELLGLTPSAISKAVSRLEGSLRVRLFQRTTRRLKLTADGDLFYRRSAQALAGLADAEAELAHGKDVPAGTLRVDLPILFGRTWITPVLLSLGRRYPELELDISFNLQGVDLFAEGIDLAVRIGALQDSSGLAARSLGQQHRVLCATPAYLDMHGRPASVADLANHECIAETRRGRPQPWPYVDEAGAAQLFAMKGRFRIGSAEVLADAARSSQGIAMLPRWFVASELRSGQLEPVLPQLFNTSLPINVLWARNRYLSPKIRVVIDELFRLYGTNPPWEAL